MTAWIERHPDGRRALYFKDLAGHRFFQQLPDRNESETIDDFSFDTLAYRYSALVQSARA